MQGGSGSATNIKFLNIEMDNVTNPIIIDQNYCDKKKKPCKKKVYFNNSWYTTKTHIYSYLIIFNDFVWFLQSDSAVQISNVLYQNIIGKSASDVAVKFDCSKKFPCNKIVLQNIDLQCEEGEAASALCNNVELSYIGHVTPLCASYS